MPVETGAQNSTGTTLLLRVEDGQVLASRWSAGESKPFRLRELLGPP